METALLVFLIMVVWISLYSHISKMNTHIDSLKRDLVSLRIYIENQLQELRKLQGVTKLPEEKIKEKQEERPVEKKPVKVIAEDVTVKEVIAKPVEKPVVKPEKVVAPAFVAAKVKSPVVAEKRVVPEPVIKPFGIVKENKKVDYENILVKTYLEK